MELHCIECGRSVEVDALEPHCPLCGSTLRETVTETSRLEAEAAPAVPSHPARIGRFRIVGRLGVGGRSEVFEGVDADLHRAVAIKLLYPQILRSRQASEHFLEEARILAKLDHPGIIPIFDAGRTPDGHCYLVMKLFRGSDLTGRIQKGRVPRDEAVEAMAQAAEALQHAHESGLIHRDVKPSNLLLASNGRIVVADFGLALREENFGTGPRFVGTIPYMSPEQARREGHRLDVRTDVYSLGVVFYELLTGQRPFTAATEEELLERIKAGTALPPSALDETIPEEYERICLKAMANRASDRYGTMRELAEDLRFLQAAERRAAAGTAPSRAASRYSNPALGAPVFPRGLRPFSESDADFFLYLLSGPPDRDGLPESIAFWKSRLECTDPAKTFSVGVMHGPSGCGKSSLVRAGLVPRLDRQLTVVLVEAAAGETELRLRQALYRHFPTLPEGADLPSTFQKLRRDLLPTGQKVVVILDQFEQWLHAGGVGGTDEMTGALRQCDGGKVQALLLVRDDFWLPLTRLLLAVEVRLQDGVNGNVVDLLDPKHARKVLFSFGQAYGRLSSSPDVTPDGAAFLDQAIASLTGEDGRISPVRLSLFVEMMKGKPWVPATLQVMGGASRVGEVFLIEAFGREAPAAQRAHAAAAGAVLEALLPVQEGTNLRGRTRSRAYLREAAGYGRRPEAFDELMRALEGELRLISPAAEPASPPSAASGTVGAVMPVRDQEYQLTHDYLVPPIRAWLELRRAETRRGRVALELTRCAAWWSAWPEDRHLPSAWSWLGGRLDPGLHRGDESLQRMLRRADRYFAVRGLVLAGALAILAGAGTVAGRKIYEEQGESHARALVAHVQEPHDFQWLEISDDVRTYRRWAEPRLRKLLEDPSYASDHVNVRMALLAVDPSQLEPLEHALLKASPELLRELLVVLQPYKAEVVAATWRVLEDTAATPGARFRAGCALAAYDPDDPRWRAAGAVVAGELIAHDPSFMHDWLPAVRPVRDVLLPPLGVAYRDPSKPYRQGVATEALAALAAERQQLLGELLLDGTPSQFVRLWPEFAVPSDLAALQMERALAQRPPQGSGADLNAWARQHARAAIALLRIGRPAHVWPLLRQDPDPRVRSYLIHAFAVCGVDPEILVQRLNAESDKSARQALILSLGEYNVTQVPGTGREELLSWFSSVYQKEPAPGIHSAVEWLERRWGHGHQIDALDRELAVRGRSAAANQTGWYVNGEVQTMVVVVPHEFTMGSPATEPGRDADEIQHRRHVPRTFAIASKPVTVGQFNRYTKDYAANLIRYVRTHSPDPACPAIGLSWWDAVRYCRWLSEQEGISENEMCYPPIDKITSGMELPANFLHRTGYRLPTEAEWEYAARGGTTTMRPYGDDDALFDSYGWHAAQSEDRTWPAGLRKPNDLGLFDALGSTWEWTQDVYRPYPTRGVGAVAGDPEDGLRIMNVDERVLRGGSFSRRLGLLRTANRYYNQPTYYSIITGLRLARTCR